MGTSFISYIERMELMAFFSGYPLIYLVVQFAAGEWSGKHKKYIQKLTFLLPYSYALTGLLFLGFELRMMYPDYSIQHFSSEWLPHFLKVWGLLSVLFVWPLCSRKTIFSLLHSLVFAYLLFKDIFLQSNNPDAHNMITNDMKIYSLSLILNIITLALIVFLSFIKMKFYKNDRVFAD